MAVLVCSPHAIEKTLELDEKTHYNSLASIHQNMVKWQTTHTPNILDIYLLNRVMKDRKHIKKVDSRTRKRSKTWKELLEESKEMRYLIENESLRSHTVATIKIDKTLLQTLKEQALENGIILGNGYGSFKNSTFRIANFPALKKKEIKYLRGFLSQYI
jgi:phosphoserine aminotransferase